jgi:hypothetical protein
VIGYWIYLMKEDVASDYCKQGEKIVSLFRDYQRASGSLKEIIGKQIHYITKPVPFSLIHEILHQQFLGTLEFKVEKNMYILKSDSQEEAFLLLKNRRLMLIASENSDIIFPIFRTLSMVSSSFFAVDLYLRHHQWMTEIEEIRKFA